jgi:hypothetical protein
MHDECRTVDTLCCTQQLAGKAVKLEERAAARSEFQEMMEDLISKP